MKSDAPKYIENARGWHFQYSDGYLVGSIIGKDSDKSGFVSALARLLILLRADNINCKGKKIIIWHMQEKSRAMPRFYYLLHEI